MAMSDVPILRRSAPISLWPFRASQRDSRTGISDKGMLYRQQQTTTDQYSIRELPLLEGERIEERFVPYDGLVANTPQKGQLMVLTNRRIMSFAASNGNKEMLLASVEDLKAVSVKSSTRGVKNLSQGLALILVGILGYFIAGYILDGITIASALGAAIIFIGVFFIAKHFFWETEGNVTFQGGSYELSFPYKSARAGEDMHRLVNRFFEIKFDPNNNQPPLGGGLVRESRVVRKACPHCMADNEGAWKLCRSCGMALDQAASPKVEENLTDARRGGPPRPPFSSSSTDSQYDRLNIS